MSKPVGEVTYAELAFLDETTLAVLLAFLEEVRTVGETMPEGAQHMLRCVKFDPVNGIGYFPGDEPKMEIRRVSGERRAKDGDR